MTDELEREIRCALADRADCITPDRLRGGINAPPGRARRRWQGWAVLTPVAAAVCAAAVVVAITMHGASRNAGAGADRPAADLTPSATAPATVASNKARAAAEVETLVNGIELPAGARPLANAPAGLRDPLVGSPLSVAAVRDHRLFQVPQPVEATFSWLVAHPPAGLSVTSPPSSYLQGGQRVHALAYDGGPATAWSDVELGVAVVALDRQHSAVRVDAMAVWLDPTPLPDSAAGPRIRVTVAAGCPHTDSNAVGVTNPDSRVLERALVPSGSPTAGLVCLYQAIGDPLIRGQRLDGAAATKLARAARSTDLSHEVGDAISSTCSGLKNSVAAVAFAYPSRPDVDVWFGCGALSNGHIAAIYDLATFRTTFTQTIGGLTTGG